MSPVYLRDLGFQRNQPEDSKGLSRTRRPERGHLGHSSGWQNNEGENINSSIHTPIQWRPQIRGLERHGSSCSAPPTPQGFFSIEHGQQEGQPGLSLGRTLSKLLESYHAVQTPEGKGNQDKGESSHYSSYRRTADPDRAYSDSLRLTSSKPNQLSSGFKPIRNQKLNGQGSPFFSIPGSFQEKTSKQVQTQDLLQSEEERVRPHDPEAVRFCERSAQEPEVAVNNSRISSPMNRNITPTQIEHNVVAPESNLNSDSLWLQVSHYGEQSQKQFTEVEASHERMKKSTSSMNKIIKTLQEEPSQLIKASEETKKTEYSL
ncbi:hypothetical protein O181_014161 [Austropuccinia psidii MF-1]|uniref:Uncharacterized protein n=1 Tax=Austropuccinia psidii MF-1 TaxID=1389203 RepID=A0A9Q3GNW8_9BASI|nr:hypothetical protein [Austropuccinia psidii MF-1]